MFKKPVNEPKHIAVKHKRNKDQLKRKNGTSTLLRMIIIFMLIFQTIFIFTPQFKVEIVEAADMNHIYVGKNGSDTPGNGTKNSPYLSIDYAYENAGTSPFTLHIYAGTYDERVYDYTDRFQSGNITNPSVIQAFERDTVIWKQGNITTASGAFQGTQIHNLTIRNITFQDAAHHAIYIYEQASFPVANISIVNCTFSNISCSAIKFDGAEDILVDNCTTDDINNCWGNVNNQEGISLSDSHRGKIRYNTMSNCYKNNIDIKGGSSRIHVFGNNINTSHGTPPPELTWNSGGGIYLDSYGLSTSLNYVYKNRIYGNFSAFHCGSEIDDGANAGCNNNTIYNNIFIVNQTPRDSQFPIYIQKSDSGDAQTRYNDFFHNTCYGGESSIGVYEDADDVIGNNFSCNILDGADTYAIRLQDIGYDIDCYNNLFNQNSELYGVAPVNGSPLFTDAGIDFHLEEGSPAVDAGINCGVTTDFDDNSRPNLLGYDIGAYEAYETGHWEGEFDYRRKIFIESDYIDTSLASFPVLVTINSTTGKKCDDGDSIRFLDVDNYTVYPHEIEYFNEDETSFVWVNVPIVKAGSDTAFWMYYGNSIASGLENNTGTWDDNFVMVHHMNGSGDQEDSTEYDNDAEVSGSSPIRTNGKVKYGQEFDEDNLEVEHTPSINVNKAFTLEIWYNDSEITTYWEDLVNKVDYFGNLIQFNLTIAYDDIFFIIRDAYKNAEILYGWNEVEVNKWCYVAITSNQTTNLLNMYLDAMKEDTETINIGNINCNDDIQIGWAGGGAENAFGGRIDEIRLSNVARNWSWINATCDTINKSSEFIYWGSEEENINISVTSFDPTIGETGIVLDTPLSFTVAHTNGSSMDITWSSNATGSWVNFATNTSVNNGTYKQYYSQINENFTKYYWRFEITDGLETYYSGNLYFTTEYGYVPGNPTGVSVDVDAAGALNITWTANNSADTTIVVSKNTSYPNNPFDGWVRQNMTRTWYNDTSITGARYFTLFSYNKTDRSKFSSGYDVDWGAIGLNCFNESSGTAITFGVEITNEDASTTYSGTGLTNTHFIETEEIPYGDNTVFYVSASGYDTRTYYYDIENNTFYNLSFYLSGSTTDTHLYYFQVLDGSNTPVAGALVNISVSIGGTFDTIANLITDSNGQNTVTLNSSKQYHVKITKSGYDTEETEWLPDPTYYGIYYPKVFVLTQTEQGQDITNVYDYITFEATMYINKTICISYDDSNLNTENTEIFIYQYYNGTSTLNTSDYRTGDNSFNISYDNANVNMTYMIVLYLNHSELGYHVLKKFVYPLNVDAVDERVYEEMFENVMGDFELGWVRTFIIFVPCIIPIILFAPQHTGLGIIVAGLYLGFTTFFIEASTQVAYATLAGVIIVMGMAVIVAKKGRRNI